MTVKADDVISQGGQVALTMIYEKPMGPGEPGEAATTQSGKPVEYFGGSYDFLKRAGFSVRAPIRIGLSFEERLMRLETGLGAGYITQGSSPIRGFVDVDFFAAFHTKMTKEKNNVAGGYQISAGAAFAVNNNNNNDMFVKIGLALGCSKALGAPVACQVGSAVTWAF